VWLTRFSKPLEFGYKTFTKIRETGNALMTFKIDFMKNNLIITLCFLCLSFQAFSQELEMKEGRYFKKGMLYSGTHTEYFENGLVSLELNIRNGLEHGALDYYFSNGVQKEHREYRDGKKHGTWITWNEQGIRMAEASYYQDVKDGTWFVWNPQGVLLYEMHYQNGLKTGTWRQWNEEGILVMERNY